MMTLLQSAVRDERCNLGQGRVASLEMQLQIK